MFLIKVWSFIRNHCDVLVNLDALGGHLSVFLRKYALKVGNILCKVGTILLNVDNILLNVGNIPLSRQHTHKVGIQFDAGTSETTVVVLI